MLPARWNRRLFGTRSIYDVQQRSSQLWESSTGARDGKSRTTECWRQGLVIMDWQQWPTTLWQHDDVVSGERIVMVDGVAVSGVNGVREDGLLVRMTTVITPAKRPDPAARR